MGEPLAENVGKWYASAFSLSKSDSKYIFQTETGGIICSPTYIDSAKSASWISR